MEPRRWHPDRRFPRSLVRPTASARKRGKRSVGCEREDRPQVFDQLREDLNGYNDPLPRTRAYARERLEKKSHPVLFQVVRAYRNRSRGRFGALAKWYRDRHHQGGFMRKRYRDLCAPTLDRHDHVFARDMDRNQCVEYLHVSLLLWFNE